MLYSGIVHATEGRSMSMTAWASRSAGWRSIGGLKLVRASAERGCSAESALRRIAPEAAGTVVAIGSARVLRGVTYDSSRVERVVADGRTVGKTGVDTIVSAHALSSAPCIARALAEIRGMLKPGGRLLFVEQDRADGRRSSRWQDRLDPLWVKVTGGRHLNRNISRHIENSGFRIEYLDTFRLKGLPGVLGRHCLGIARLR
jgi:hypothetical protein